MVRGRFCRRKYVITRDRCVRIQAFARKVIARSYYVRKRVVVIIVQAAYRGAVGRRRASYVKSSARATAIQSWARMVRRRRRFLLLRRSTIVAQSLCRMRLSKKKCADARKEAEKQASLQGQLDALQLRLEEERRLREEAQAGAAVAAKEISVPTTPAARPPLASPDKTLLKDTTSLIATLRGEIEDLRGANEKLKRNNGLLHKQLRKTKESYVRASSSFAMLNASFKKVAKRLKEAKRTDAEQKARIKALRCSVAIAKEESAVAKKLYASELSCRMKLEKLYESKRETFGGVSTSPIIGGKNVGIMAAVADAPSPAEKDILTVLGPRDQNVPPKSGKKKIVKNRGEKLKVARPESGLSIFLRWLRINQNE